MDETQRDLTHDDHAPPWEEAIVANADADADAELETVAPAAPWWRTHSGAAITLGVLGACATATLAAALWWPRAPLAQAAIALPAAQQAAARVALDRAGIAVAARDGALWVSTSQARRALEVLAADRPAPNAMASALADESVFASSDMSRARRLVATMQALESAIGQQPGVARAQVVLSESNRTGAPGSSSGASAAVTIQMRAGVMPQDLVDAVAVLVSGASSGLRPEQVAILDVVAGRARQPRGAEARAMADLVRVREERAAMLVASLLPEIPNARVAVHEADSGGVVATVVLPRAYARALAATRMESDIATVLASERDRIRVVVEPFLACPGGGCPIAVAVMLEREGADSSAEEVRTDAASDAAAGEALDAAAGTALSSARTPPAAPLAARTVAQQAVDEATARERAMPLGPTLGSASAPIPYGWMLAALAGGGALVWWSWNRPRVAVASGRWNPGTGAAAGGGGRAREPRVQLQSSTQAAEESTDAMEVAEVAGTHACDAVRGAPEHASAVVRGWLDAGYDARVACLIVALDAGAAGLLLRTLPVHAVQAATAALGVTDSPTPEALADASHAFLAEMELLREPAAYRAAPEAA